MELRSYQNDVLEMVTGATEGNLLIQAPTGAGKTIMFSKSIEAMAKRGDKCLVLAHRGELIRQAEDKLEKSTGLKCAVFSAYMKRKEFGSIVVASIQSLARFDGPLDFDVVIIDEAHRVPSRRKDSQYGKVLGRMNARIVGFTATPYRLDSGAIYGEMEWWKDLNYQIPLRHLIDEGFLVDYVHKVAVETKRIKRGVDGLRVTAGDYNERESEGLMSSAIAVNAIKNTVTDDDKAIVVFCVSIKHAEAVQESIGEDCVMVHSKIPSNERDENLRRFDCGEVRWIVNVGVLTEGWDCSRVDCVVLARPTKSTALYVQMVGRGLRLHEGKEKLKIYDIVGSFETFGLVDDPEIHQSEQDRGDCGVKVCDACLAVIPSNAKTCPECDFSFSEKEQVEQDKVQVDDEDKAYVVKDVTIDNIEDDNIGTVTGGYATYYESRKGTKCLKVEYFHTKGHAVHYYPINQSWLGTKLASIAKRYSTFKGSYLEPNRFKNAVNGGHIFPMKNLKLMESDNGFKKISTL